MKRQILKTWHSLWIDYWSVRLDNPVQFTTWDAKTHAEKRHYYHVVEFNKHY
jgi:hypothetical protein